MKEIFRLIALLAATSTVVGCGIRLPAGSVQSAKRRVTAPDVTAGDLDALVDGNSTFAFELYQVLRDDNNGNLFYSPHSISLALAMTYAGASDETERQMADSLHFVLPRDRLHPAFNELDLELARRGEGAKGKDAGGFRLNIVNAIWGQEGYELLDAFLDTLAENYGSGLRLLDLAGDPETSRVTINDWVSEQTEDRIEELIPRGAVDTLTRMVLTNAIFFNAAWAEQFEEGATSDGPFFPLDGSTVTVPMMRQTESFGYAEVDGLQAVELPYDGHEFSMVILLPAEGEFRAFEETLDAPRVDAIVQDMGYTRIGLTLPRFEFESGFKLKEALAAMGMPVAFSPEADFSGMTGSRELFIGDVLHKAFVSVSEAGTEAAAATAVIMPATARQEELVAFIVDRPFVFFIRDIDTGAVLFVGRVVDPRA